MERIKQKYPETRDEMSIDRERGFLKDLYDAYETVGRCINARRN